jgi:hypothetical protein
MYTHKSDDPLVSLLYSLMRDHVQPGVIEKLVTEVEKGEIHTVYTNGYLAQYARDIVIRLQDKAQKADQVPR